MVRSAREVARHRSAILGSSVFLLLLWRSDRRSSAFIFHEYARSQFPNARIPCRTCVSREATQRPQILMQVADTSSDCGCTRDPVVTMTFLKQQLRANAWQLLGMMGALMGVMTCTALDKILVGQFIQRCLVAGEPALFLPLLSRVLVLQVFAPLLECCYAFAAQRINLRVVSCIQRRLFDMVLFKIQMSELESRKLVSLLGLETDRFKRILQIGVRSLTGVFLFGSIISWQLLKQRRPQLWWVLWLLLLVTGFGATAAWMISRNLISPTSSQEASALRKVISRVTADVGAIAEIRAYELERVRSSCFRMELADVQKSAMNLAIANLGYFLLDAWRQSFLLMAIYCLAGRCVMVGLLSYEVYHALFGLSLNFAASVKGVLDTYVSVQALQPTIRDINKMSSSRSMDISPFVGARAAAENNDLMVTGLRLSRVVDGCSVDVLVNVSFQLLRGTITALVGPSGAGKSSLVGVLLGLEHPSGGSVSLGGFELTDFKDHAEAIAWVSQEPHLFFDSTVTTNIAVGEHVDIDRLHRCIKDAGASDFLDRRLNDVIGQTGGWAPSVGERQRIAIARALYKEAPILVFDEPNSALDAQCERGVLEVLKKQARQQGRTVFLVTHRLNTAEVADQILVMDRGRIVQSGPHHRLISDKNGLYRKLRDEASF